MKFLAVIYLLLFSFISIGQIDLAVQRAHSDDIIQLEFSNSNRFLVSLGRNNEFVIWDLNHEKSIASFALSTMEKIKGMKFSADDDALIIESQRATFYYSILNESIKQDQNGGGVYRDKTLFKNSNEDSFLSLRKGVIIKRIKNRRVPKYKLNVPNIKSNFTAFDANEDLGLVVAVAENEVLYVFDYNSGLKKKELTGHTSQLFDVRFSPDGNTFVTAGRDRSIAIWDSKTLKLKSRLTSNVFRKKSVAFSKNGTSIYVGDELGYVYSVDFSYAFPKIEVNRPSFHAVNKIIATNSKNDSSYFLVTANNLVYKKAYPTSSVSSRKFAYRDHQFQKGKSILIEHVFESYQDPFGEINLFDQSPNGHSIIYSGKSDFPSIAFANVETGKVQRVYKYYDNEEWTDIGFFNDSTFIGIQDSSNVLHFWMMDGKKIRYKTDTLSFVLQDFEVIDSNNIWLNSKHYGQFYYNPYTRIPTQIMKDGARESFKRNQFMILENYAGALDFYDLDKDKMYNRFIGHKEKVTDIQFHPDGNKFVTSSNDGTIRFWGIKEKRGLATFIPFKNEEFVFITGDNYYLMSKGAMDEIGFKVKGKYYYPEQFDLKFNRPDIVLSQLNFSDPNLIPAYRQAYLKRLKKMNFTEGQLRANFNLPSIELLNRKQINSKTGSDSIVLQLQLKDELIDLDRINIWVNDVAVFGVNGIDIRDLKTSELQKNITIYLAEGNNKIEMSVLNQSGIESYKELIEVFKAGIPKLPNLFIATIGTSKHADARYDLNYADKDAKDLAQTFKESSYFETVNELILTNEQVVLENLLDVKTFLSKAAINDVVILFIAGHGVLDVDFNYYFATHDMDFDNPKKRGVPYEAIERLLDGIKALKKILFIDTCHSGELDKDEIKLNTDNTNDDGNEQGEIIFRRAGAKVELKDEPLDLKGTNDLMKLLFNDLRKGTGATVISSSGGVELAIEANRYKNGLFTYVLISGLRSGNADLNQDGVILISEIQQYTQDQVSFLSKGLQTPTSRIQNNELDYRLW